MPQYSGTRSSSCGETAHNGPIIYQKSAKDTGNGIFDAFKIEFGKLEKVKKKTCRFGTVTKQYPEICV